MVKLSVVGILAGISLFAVGVKINHLQIPPRDVIGVTECTSSEVGIWELQPYPESCRWYIYCMNNVGVIRECPDELYFDPSENICNHPEDVDCEESIETTTEEEQTTTTEETTVTDETIITEETTVTDEITVTDETTVTDDITVTDETEENTVTEETTSSEETTIIEETTTSEETTVTAETTEPDLCEPLCANFPDRGGELADPENCGQFISCDDECFGGRMFCPPDLHFNHIKQVCDTAVRAECLMEVCVEQPNGVLSSANSCQHFYACIDEGSLLLSCGTGTVFDSEETCVVEDEINTCVSEEFPSPPLELQKECKTIVSQNFRHPDYCDVYYRCVAGILFPRRCQPGLLYDGMLQVCNLEELVDCIV
ncbi:uncharacterized protein LOC129724770 [Wyeomyia smithii]|uniref:uncharacterized protein LOC129724770 n=1 Tax=Wyeomyia smithii TaxID=174621 RepID=UPI002467B41A|nr:uncharacterized protein LOC129724770 [Wyeomyia smithii]